MSCLIAISIVFLRPIMRDTAFAAIHAIIFMSLKRYIEMNSLVLFSIYRFGVLMRLKNNWSENSVR